MLSVHRVFVSVGVLAAVVVLGGQSLAQDSDRVLSTGVTGMITSRGLDNPRYVLTRKPVQRLILEIADNPISPEAARQRLSGGVVELHDLLDLDLLRVQNDVLYLNYLVLTRKDRARIRDVALTFGESLANAFQTHSGEFDALLADYQESARPDLAFVLVAGFILNWEGLLVTTELGFRAEARTWPNGDRYIIHSSEYGAELPLRELYWGSHTYPGAVHSLTTLGDGPSQPRAALPDVIESLATGLDGYGDVAELHGASVSLLLAYMAPALDHAGAIMAATAHRPYSMEELAEQIDIERVHLNATAAFLEAAGYVARDANDKLSAKVVVLTAADEVLVNTALDLGREIIRDWIQTNYADIQLQLADLTPVRHGLPFELAFSEVWHDIFGVAARELAQSGFMRDPYGPESQFDGFVPFVWESLLYDR